MAADDNPIADNAAARRFELNIDGETAFLAYERRNDALALIHTEVPESLRGRNIGGRLVEAAVSAAHAQGLRIIAVCPFARAYLRKPHPNQHAE